MSRVLTSMALTEKEDLRVLLTTVRQKECIDVRIFSVFEERAEKAPTGRGFSLSKTQFQNFRQSLANLGDV